jgi:hypothetical protein
MGDIFDALEDAIIVLECIEGGIVRLFGLHVQAFELLKLLHGFALL